LVATCFRRDFLEANSDGWSCNILLYFVLCTLLGMFGLNYGWAHTELPHNSYLFQWFLSIYYHWAAFSPIRPTYPAAWWIFAVNWSLWPSSCLASVRIPYLVIFVFNIIFIFISQHTPVNSCTCTTGQIQYLFSHPYECVTL